MTKNLFTDLLKNSDFLKIWISQILSQITLNLINFVIVIRIFEFSHSTVAVSLVWIFYAMPALIIGPLSGTIVDFVDKRKILIITTFIEAVVVLFYLFIHTRVWPIYSVIFFYSLFNQLYIPAEASTLTVVVPKKLLSIANTVFLITIYGSLLLGFGVAGSLVKMVGPKVPFLLSSLLLLLATLAVYRLPKGMKAEKMEINGMPDFWLRVKEGYLFIKGKKEVLFPLVLLVLANVVISVLAILAPTFVTEMLSADLLDAGLIVIFPLGLGAVVGAFGVTLALRKRRKKPVASFGLSLLAIVLLFMGIILPSFHTERILLAIVSCFLLGVGIISLFVPAQTSMQEQTPLEFRGRVFGVLGFLFTLASVLPILVTAAMADVINVNLVIILIGLILGSIAIYSLREPYLPNLNHDKTRV